MQLFVFHAVGWHKKELHRRLTYHCSNRGQSVSDTGVQLGGSWGASGPSFMRGIPFYFSSKIQTPRTPDLEVWGSSLVCHVSLDEELYSTLSLITQVYKWVLVTYCWGLTLQSISIPSRGGIAILLGMLHANKTGISSGHLSLWLLCTFTSQYLAPPTLTAHTNKMLPLVKGFSPAIFKLQNMGWLLVSVVGDWTCYFFFS